LQGVKLLINKRSKIRRKKVVCKDDGINVRVRGKNFNNNMLPSSQCPFAKIKYLGNQNGFFDHRDKLKGLNCIVY
jgi:hypothetical protein